jgi:hypothetical protein
MKDSWWMSEKSVRKFEENWRGFWWFWVWIWENEMWLPIFVMIMPLYHVLIQVLITIRQNSSGLV